MPAIFVFPVAGAALCRCYSVACPEGELGDVHVSTIQCLVPRGLFERLKEHGWQF